MENRNNESKNEYSTITSKFKYAHIFILIYSKQTKDFNLENSNVLFQRVGLISQQLQTQKREDPHKLPLNITISLVNTSY